MGKLVCPCVNPIALGQASVPIAFLNRSLKMHWRRCQPTQTTAARRRVCNSIGVADQSPKRKRRVFVNRRGLGEQALGLRTHSLALGALIQYQTRVMTRVASLFREPPKRSRWTQTERTSSLYCAWCAVTMRTGPCVVLAVRRNAVRVACGGRDIGLRCMRSPRG